MNAEKVKKPGTLAVMIVATVLLAAAALTMTTIENTFATNNDHNRKHIWSDRGRA